MDPRRPESPSAQSSSLSTAWARAEDLHFAVITRAYRSIDNSSRLPKLPQREDSVEVLQHNVSLRNEAKSHGLCLSKPPFVCRRSGNGHVVPVVVHVDGEEGRRWGESDDQPSA